MSRKKEEGKADKERKYTEKEYLFLYQVMPNLYGNIVGSCAAGLVGKLHVQVMKL